MGNSDGIGGLFGGNWVFFLFLILILLFGGIN